VRLHPLPIDAFLPEILARVRERRAAVITAAPGAGKTTRVPPALAADGAVLVLQPRRVAARSIASRIAAEQGWTVGDEVGWHVRFERRFGARTRVLLATEGILTARLQQDPLLSDFRTVILDEFHERTIHADLGIALAKQAWLARPDFRLVVMSATLDTPRVAAYLEDCPTVAVPGALHPIEIVYSPGTSVAAAAREALARTRGSVLCFLPGAPEIRAVQGEVTALVAAAGSDVVPLHGSLPAQEQDAALEAVLHPRVILATNIAETSLTVPGVVAVVDSGLQKTSRYDPDRAIDSLETERIPQESADQRAGRAGRLGPGYVVRLWSRADRLRPQREPEIARVDLSGPLLDVLAWGGDPSTLDWFEAPPREAIAAASDLLRRLGAVSGQSVTELGRQMQRLPLHPRLARILVAAGGAREAALACAVLSERHWLPGHGPRATTGSDLLTTIDPEGNLPAHVRHVADVLQSIAGSRGTRRLDERAFRHALFHGYPDRVGRRRDPGSPRVLLASGHGAVVSTESGVRDGEFLLAIDVSAGRRGETSEARIRIASIVDPRWLTAETMRLDHELDDAGTVRAVRRELYGEMVLREAPQAPDPIEAERILAEAYSRRERSAADEQILHRLRFAGVNLSPQELVERAVAGKRSLREIDLGAALPYDLRQQLESLAPREIRVPSGRSARLEYQADGTVIASVKLQELFGLADTPRVGSRREPVLLALLAPNGRPVQVTRDLRSFWTNTYPQLRKALRGRYPKHPWPDDPWSATPTARTTRRR
jgi:ATP-dependent helicase HrpB